jgi:dihydrofolate reductase
MSLDGFIARTNGDLDWLQGSGNGAADYGYQRFIARINAIVMGRRTFEKVLTFGKWPYEKPVIILTHRSLRIPTELRSKVEIMEGTPKEIVCRLAERGHAHLYLDGGRTIQEFLRAGLVNELVLSRLPILLGKGIPLFGPLPSDTRLKHSKTKVYPGGMVQSTYEILKGH